MLLIVLNYPKRRGFVAQTRTRLSDKHVRHDSTQKRALTIKTDDIATKLEFLNYIYKIKIVYVSDFKLSDITKTT